MMKSVIMKCIVYLKKMIDPNQPFEYISDLVIGKFG